MPNPGDSGSAIGAVAAHTQRHLKWSGPYLGTDIKQDVDIKSLVDDLEAGRVVALANGRAEFGPRALGNRSIIGEVTNPGTYDKINNKLQRNDFMPFAPAVMEEHADTIFNVTKSRYTAEFMTMLYDTRPEWSDKIPTVVHPKDKTARIKIVTPKSNPTFHKILDEYNKITGVPVLLNTSFNVHEEPIVCHPNEAFNHLENNVVDLLIINNFIYKKYEGHLN